MPIVSGVPKIFERAMTIQPQSNMLEKNFLSGRSDKNRKLQSFKFLSDRPNHFEVGSLCLLLIGGLES